MEMDGRQFNVTEGTDVYGSDGDKIGSIVAVQPNYVVVEKGFFFPTDYYIPSSAFASYDDDKLYLNVAKDQALNQGWDVEPTGDVVTTAGYTATGAGYSADAARTDASYLDTETASTDASYLDTETASTGAAYADTTRATDMVDDDTLRVAVHEEELTATKREREIGQFRIDKDVVAEERTLDVPVTEERVRVERHVVDRAVGADEGAFEEGTIEVPIRGEEVQVQKQTRVAEEIEIGKEAVQRTEQVGGTVRREEVRISEDVEGDIDRGRNA
jgi:uncharacterized protein (TIGR02271 family)